MNTVAQVEIYSSRSGNRQWFDLFGPAEESNAARACLVYGRNGAGKSSLAKDLAKSLKSGEALITFKDGTTSRQVTARDGEVVRPSLFNEDIIREAVFEQQGNGQGGLQTIVMFGEQIDRRTKLDEIEDEIQDRATSIEVKQRRLHELENPDGLIAKKMTELKKKLKQEEGWAEFRKRAENRKKQPVINDGVLGDFIHKYSDDIADSRNLVEILRERETLVKRLEQNSDRNKIDPSFALVLGEKQLDELDSLLSQEINSDPATPIEEHFVKTLNDPALRSSFDLAADVIVDRNTACCPACTQEIPPELRRQISSAIQSIRSNAERQALIERLEQLAEVEFVEVTDFRENEQAFISAEALRAVGTARESVLKELTNIKQLIRQKVSAPEAIVNLSLIDFRSAVERLETAAQVCKSELEARNATIDRFDEDLQLFNDLNRLAVAKTADSGALIRELSECLNEEKALRVECKSQASHITQLEKEKLEIEAAAQDLNLAVDLMNRFLRVVFAEPGRLSLELGTDCYVVKSRNKDVRVSDLSTGERNVITLVYFLADIFRDSSDYEHCKRQRFIILDDPLSSFDRDNKTGVFLLLRQVIGKFLEGNKSTQLVILSHDLGLIQDFHAVLKSVDGVSTTSRELETSQLRSIKLDEFGSYTEHLKKIYEFAARVDFQGVLPAQIPAGNEMRLVLEAFAEFVAATDIVSLPKKAAVRDALEGTSIAIGQYFQSSLYRLLLHGESHSSDSIRAGAFDFAPQISPAERRLMCRDLLCLIYSISSVHIPAKLSMKRGRDSADLYNLNMFETLITDWQSDIERRTLR
ncbi:AAA family ATPase [Corynebacterium senegalense]|uniref:AAA family ATPase n=1 Tax=Corynebacterium senegalense TaxID=2080750 RepID=UPI000E20ABF3|nr:AAA family ATPase [Corynebacterium senegalense]